ncbi:MAG: hypothetical protein IPK68_15005 [Bdellovibrionales bacterium]|nr:hypothetical protein [Bdellovibrionales bacterium]
MKGFFYSLLVGATMLSGYAHACHRSAEQLICPGDTVVSNDNIVGTVLGVNPFHGNIAFRSNSSGTTYTRSKMSLALGLGCLEMYCVGDQIVSSENIVGTILAVNLHQNSIAFRSHSFGYIYTRRLESLSLGLGCVRGICVGDTIISSDNINAKVLAVNPFSSAVAFRSNSSGNVYTRAADSLSSSEYCDSYGSYHY